MIDFDEIKQNLDKGSYESIEANTSDFEAIDSLKLLPEGARLLVLDDYFPETIIWRDGEMVVAEISEHIYTKYWEHKWHGRAFAQAMLRAIKRFIAEGRPFEEGVIEHDDDPHIFIRWKLRLPATTSGKALIKTIGGSFDLVCARAELILEDAENVLVLGKDTGEGLDRLRAIAAQLEALGYYPIIIKDQADKLGESVIQKVMRHALSSKFILVENTEASGHLYEIPHVGKAAECVIGFLQEENKGATWMFEDAFARNQHWNKFVYATGSIEGAVEVAARWAEDFVKKFGAFQQRVLPWM